MWLLDGWLVWEYDDGSWMEAGRYGRVNAAVGWRVVDTGG